MKKVDMLLDFWHAIILPGQIEVALFNQQPETGHFDRSLVLRLCHLVRVDQIPHPVVKRE